MTTPDIYILSEMTSPEIGEALEHVQLAIIPTGACEQHGPNMTMETDSAIAHAVAKRLTKRLHPRALLVPTVPWGISPHHMSFPGTISLQLETYNALLWDVVTSLKHHGIKYFLFVNGHGGNMNALNLLSLKMRTELDINVAVMFYLRLASDVVSAGAQTTLYGHACEVEVSVGFYAAPQVVRSELELGAVKPYDHAYTDIKTATRIDYPFVFDDFTANGALGDARLATKDFGKEIIDTALDRSIEFLETFLPPV